MFKTKIDNIDTLTKTKNDKVDSLFKKKILKNIPWLATRPHYPPSPGFYDPFQTFGQTIVL